MKVLEESGKGDSKDGGREVVRRLGGCDAIGKKRDGYEKNRILRLNKTHIHRKIGKMKRHRAVHQMKEQDKTPEKQLNEVEIGNLPEKKFRKMIVKMIQDLGKRMEAKIEKMQEMFNKDLEELKNKQTEMNNTITEMKNTLEGINSRITEAEQIRTDKRLLQATLCQ